MMQSTSQTVVLDGPSGRIEALVDTPQLPAGQSLRGVAVVAHPHPLYGGAMTNKVVQTVARACVLGGWQAVRFNFRGVGSSQGSYDEGRGELEDLLSVVAQVAPQGPLVLAGFSFGAFVTSHAVAKLADQRDIERVVLVGTAASRFSVAPIAPDLHHRTLVVHGEVDDTVPLAAVMEWARSQHLPVTVIPGVEHFFHGQLPLLRTLVLRHLPH